MAYGSTNNRGENVVQELDALSNPFTFLGRTIKGGVTSVDDMLRGLGRAGGAILSDVIAEPVRGLVPGGREGWWKQEDGNRAASTYRDVLKPVGLSFANTVDMLGDITYLPNLIGWSDAGTGRANEQFMDRIQQLNDDPFNFLLEHVGNAAIVGGLAAKPAQLGIASSRGAVTGGQVARAARPLAGRGVRRTARTATQQAAQEGSRAARAAMFSDDVIGHPYRSAARKVRDSDLTALIRDPKVFDPVTNVANAKGVGVLDDIGEGSMVPSAENHVTLYRGLSEDFDLQRVSDEGDRFTDQVEYALSNTNDTPHSRLYAVDVPESRVDIGVSAFADVLGENAGPRGARLTPDELEGLREVDPQTLEPLFPEQGPSPYGASSDLPQALTREVKDTLTGPEQFAQAIGEGLEGVRQSEGYQNLLGSDTRMGRRIGDAYQRGKSRGQDFLAEQVRARFFDKDTAVGTTNVQRKWDPSRVERLLLRDLKNLKNRKDSARYQSLIDEIDFDSVTLRSAPGRAREVASGSRVVGQTLTPEQLLTRIQSVLEEVRRQTGGESQLTGRVLQEMLPGVDPMGLYLLALNAVEKSRGLPDNSLTSALADYLSMDRFADVNRRAQAAGAQVPNSIGNRFNIPEQELGVDLNALPDEAQAVFYEAAEQYRRDLASQREPMLVEEGVIPEAGTRVGRAGDEPTQFPTELEDLPLSSEWRQRLRNARRDKAAQDNVVDDVAARLDELAESGRALYKPRKNGGGVYRTQTGEAFKRATARLRRETKKRDRLARQLDELEEAARLDPTNAPVSARNLLVYANRVAPEQAKSLRAMADEGLGDPVALNALADELDAIPKTLEDLNSSEVYLAYLKEIKDRGVSGANRTGAERGPLNTRAPGGTRRRGDALDIDYSRDFRARAYWQDSEFQSWFLARQADETVKRQGLAKSGRQRLREQGLTERQIDNMTENQAQQTLERLGLRVYQPDQLFGTGRKPSAGNALDADWITPFAENALTNSLKAPGWFERTLMEGIYDPAINAWKVWALPLRLGWQVNNLAGSALLTTLVGQVSPFDYPSLLRASRQAVSNWNKGITDEIRIPLTDTYRHELVRALQTVDEAQGASIREWLQEDAILLSNEVLNDISSSGLTRGDFAWLNNSQFLRDLGGNQNILQQFDVELPQVPGRLAERGRNLRQTGREVVDLAYHVNETVDNMHRAIVYIDQIGKGSTHAEAMAQVVKALGDYNKMTGFERRVIKRVYPFYPWMRHITEVVATSMHPSNIKRTVIFTHLTNTMGEPNEWEALLPEWASGHIYMGMDDNGRPKFLSTRGLNPFLDVFDPVAQPNMRGLLRPTNPAIQFGYEQVSGTSVLTGRPFSSPGQAFGQTSDDPPTPPLGEYLFRNVPQLGAARDVYRDLMGQPLTRYGTGEAAFFEGAEEGRSSLQDIQQLFGYNIRPLDVEQMRERELVRELQAAEAQANYEEQLEQQGGRQARDLLNALPGLGS